MKFRESKLAGAFFVEPEPRRDGAAGQTRLFCARSFTERGLDARVGQSAIVRVGKRGTIRGMHLERGETKLVRCVTGKVFHVMIDLRVDSPTFTKWEGTILKEEDDRAIYMPPGIAHGYQALTNDVTLLVHLSGHYGDSGVFGVRYDDPNFAISWPIAEAAVSPRDAAFPPFDPEKLRALLSSASRIPPGRPSILALDYP